MADKTKIEEKVVNFRPEQLKAPFLLRCGAILIDYILLVIVPVLSLLAGRSFGADGGKLLNGQLNSAGWLIAILIGLSNCIIFPMLSGQSIGKILTGLRIVNKDGASVSLTKLLVRQLIGYPLIVLTGGLGFLLAALSRNGRALDDLLAGTMVVYGQRRQK